MLRQKNNIVRHGRQGMSLIKHIGHTVYSALQHKEGVPTEHRAKGHGMARIGKDKSQKVKSVRNQRNLFHFNSYISRIPSVMPSKVKPIPHIFGARFFISQNLKFKKPKNVFSSFEKAERQNGRTN